MTDKRIKLTEEQAKKLELDYNRLLKLGHTQFVEHQLWLRTQLRNLTALDDSRRIYLTSLVDEMTFGLITTEAGIKEKDEQTISVIYEYPDALHDFLSSTEAPAHLNLSKQGGITLSEHPVVV